MCIYWSLGIWPDTFVKFNIFDTFGLVGNELESGLIHLLSLIGLIEFISLISLIDLNLWAMIEMDTCGPGIKGYDRLFDRFELVGHDRDG